MEGRGRGQVRKGDLLIWRGEMRGEEGKEERGEED